MSNIHVMADVENLSVEPNGPVLTIGLVAFDITSGEIVAEFYERMDRNLAQKYGTPSLSTLKWWESQDEAARAEATRATWRVACVSGSSNTTWATAVYGATDR